MKKFLTSYVLSAPMLLLALVCFIQASNKSLTVAADEINQNQISSDKVLVASGIILFVLGAVSIILRYTIKEKR